MFLLFFILLAYLLGSLSFAVLIARKLRLPDPRQQGSKNPGATNVLRLGGKKAAILVLLGDMLKGLVTVWLAKLAGIPEAALVWVGLAAFLGHLYPLFFRFQGGKGVATALGVLLALAWPVALAVLATWLAVALLSRYSSFAALLAAALAPVYNSLFGNRDYLLGICIMVAFLVWRHRTNIVRLLTGSESQIKLKSSN